MSDCHCAGGHNAGQNCPACASALLHKVELCCSESDCAQITDPCTSSGQVCAVHSNYRKHHQSARAMLTCGIAAQRVGTSSYTVAAAKFFPFAVSQVAAAELPASGFTTQQLPFVQLILTAVRATTLRSNGQLHSLAGFVPPQGHCTAVSHCCNAPDTAKELRQYPHWTLCKPGICSQASGALVTVRG